MGENKVGRILKVIGIIIIVFGIISSFIAAWLFPIIPAYGMHMPIVQEFYNWPLAVMGSIASFMSGILFIGFAEIIQLLDENRTELKRIQKQL